MVKKAIDALAVACSLSVPWKESKIEMHMWLKPIPTVPMTIPVRNQRMSTSPFQCKEGYHI